MLHFIPIERLDDAWPLVGPWLEQVEKRSKGKETVAALRDELSDGRAQLWLWISADELKALAVTETVKHPSTFICRIRIVTGKERHEWLAPSLDGIERWAASVGCEYVEPVARLGWQRDLKALGYRAHHIQMSKRIAP